MASPGGVGTKFVSVNLNKSYGKPSNSYSHAAAYSSSRVRSSSSGGSGRMVVLSRPRNVASSAPKTGPKLSVPPPLNLPSLRKEHERLDLLASGGSIGTGAAGSGSGHGSTGMGWSKPGALDRNDNKTHPGGNMECPPAEVSMPRATSEKSAFLKGEDFPSLHATLHPASSVHAHKQKDLTKTKQKLSSPDAGPDSGSLVKMRPQMQHPSQTIPSSRATSGGDLIHSEDGATVGRSQKLEDIFLGPLPIVRLSHTREWADDERDTGHGISVRGRDAGLMKGERELSYSRGGFSHAMDQGSVDGQTIHAIDKGGHKMESYGRDVRATSRESRQLNSWRLSPLAKEEHVSPDAHAEKKIPPARSSAFGREMGKDFSRKNTDLSHPGSSGSAPAISANEVRDARHGKRDSLYGIREQEKSHVGEAYFGRKKEQNAHAGNNAVPSNQLAHKSSPSRKNSVSMDGQGLHNNDPILNLSRQKQLLSNGKKLYAEERFGMPEFDGRDQLLGALVLKKRKESAKQADFHDPVRESFEAELERVQKMQEQERQRIAEEQARALAAARREEEERVMQARKEEERRRRMEEEEREAAWKAEQERLEALRHVEEQRIAREEEKKRIFMEEERRKEAARQKLLELEARIAKRQSESMKTGSTGDKPTQKDSWSVADVRNSQDDERMPDIFISSPSSDSSGLNRTGDASSVFRGARDASNLLLDKDRNRSILHRNVIGSGNGAKFISWEQDNGYYNTRWDPLRDSKTSRKEVFAPARMPSRNGGITESVMTNDTYPFKDKRWNVTYERGDHVRDVEIGSELPETHAEKFSEIGWGQARLKTIPRSPDNDKFSNYMEVNEFPLSSRSRYSMRQPHVLPPPSVAYAHKNSLSNHLENSSSAVSHDRLVTEENGLASMVQNECTNLERYRWLQPADHTVEQESVCEKQREDLQRCKSPSSVAISSPSGSSAQFSHDDLDDKEPFPSDENDHSSLPDNGHVISEFGDLSKKIGSANYSSSGNEEWVTEGTTEDLQVQEKHVDEKIYKMENDVLKEGREDLEVACETPAAQSEDSSVDGKMENEILCFNEGIQVEASCGDEFEVASQNDEKVMAQEQEESYGEADNDLSEVHMDVHSKLDESEVTSEALHSPSTLSDLTNTVKHVSLETSASHQPDISCSSTMCAQHIQQHHQIPITSSASNCCKDSADSLQFGLFSGPSLIPSPLPAIQIGSIQMPLHLHSQPGFSLSQMHQSSFQFGQFSFASPISQGMLTVSPQTISLMHPNVISHPSLNRQNVESVQKQTGQKSYSSVPHSGENVLPVDLSSLPVKSAGGLIRSPVATIKSTTTAAGRKDKDVFFERHHDYHSVGRKRTSGASHVETRSFHGRTRRRPYRSVYDHGDLRFQQSKFYSSNQTFRGSGVSGSAAGWRGKKFGYTARRYSRSSYFVPSEAPQAEPNNFQRRHRQSIRRTEFRLRKHVGERELEVIPTEVYPVQDKKFNNVRVSVNSERIGAKKVGFLNKPSGSEFGNLTVPGTSSFQNGGSRSQAGMPVRKEAPSRKQTAIQQKSNFHGISAENGDPPLGSGVVCIFKQPGIEAPSDEDNFIEVRSKRQMLNDRKQQREKELKAKSKVVKVPRKLRITSEVTQSYSSTNRRMPISPSGGMSVDVSSTQSDCRAITALNFMIPELPASSMASSSLAADVDSRTNSKFSKKSINTVPHSLSSNAGSTSLPNLTLQSKSRIIDQNDPSSDDARVHSDANQQVEVQKCTATEEPSVIGCSGTAMNSCQASISVVAQTDKQHLSSGALNSVLAEEKIQFGAVTSAASPTDVSDRMKLPDSMANIVMPTHTSLMRPDENAQFGKDRHSGPICVHLDDAEAEAEAAASAIAVAAITGDELAGGSLSNSGGNVCSSGALSSSVSENKQSLNHLKCDDSSISLPADLSVETPPLSLWPPLQSSPSTSNPALSSFHGAPAYPCYDMSTMLGGHIYAFGPQQETRKDSNQEKGCVRNGVQSGTWQHGADSYCPAGFAHPFVSPGGMTGFQGPPHMVVYNHFAPLNQYGQMGMGIMGATCIPAKQQEVKHTAVQTSSGEIGNLSLASVQNAMTHMAGALSQPPVGSPLMALPSPLAVFDTSFQTSVGMSMQTSWPHAQPSAFQSVPLSQSHWQQVDGVVLPHFEHENGECSTGRRLSNSQDNPGENGRQFTSKDVNSSSQLNELGLVDLTIRNSSAGHALHTGGLSADCQNEEDGGLKSSENVNSKTIGHSVMHLEKQNLGNGHALGYSSQKINSVRAPMGDWQRKMGLQGRIRSTGSDKSYSGASSKMKQVYVAKHAPTSGPVIGKVN